LKEQVEALLNLLMSAWRFRWTALRVAAVVGALGALAVLIYPGKYESQAEIYIDTRSVLQPLLKGLAVQAQSKDQGDVVRQALLARPTLDRVARQTGLYARAHGAVEADQLLFEMAHAITVDGDATTGLYTIAYDDPNPRMAQAVVKALLETFVANSIGAARSDTQNAAEFLAQQVAVYQQRLSQSEQRLAAFKKRYVEFMPNSGGSGYFGILQATLEAQDKLRTELAVAMARREELRSKIARDNPVTTRAGSMPSDREIEAAETLDARIRKEQATLSKLLERFTDRYPTVVTEKALIARLERQRRTEFGNVRITDAMLAPNSMTLVDPIVQSLQEGLNNSDLQITTLRAELRQTNTQVADLERTLTIGPGIEAQLAQLTRNYGVNRAEYDALLQRLEAARISNEADRSEALRFKVLEPPRVPLRPIKPNKRILLLGALLFALLAGAGVAVLRAQLHPVFLTKEAVGAALKLPVIGQVSHACRAEESLLQRRDLQRCGSALLAGFAVFLILWVFDFSASQLLQYLVGMGRG
jgi:polysaccharide chain length determinant protein (PEP-CTERM system associated)